MAEAKKFAAMALIKGKDPKKPKETEAKAERPRSGSQAIPMPGKKGGAPITSEGLDHLERILASSPVTPKEQKHEAAAPSAGGSQSQPQNPPPITVVAPELDKSTNVVKYGFDEPPQQPTSNSVPTSKSAPVPSDADFSQALAGNDLNPPVEETKSAPLESSDVASSGEEEGILDAMLNKFRKRKPAGASTQSLGNSSTKKAIALEEVPLRREPTISAVAQTTEPNLDFTEVTFDVPGLVAESAKKENERLTPRRS